MANTNLKHLSPIFGLLFFLLLIILAILNRSVNMPMQTDWHKNINSEMRVIMPEFINDNLYIGFEINLSDIEKKNFENSINAVKELHQAAVKIDPSLKI